MVTGAAHGGSEVRTDDLARAFPSRPRRRRKAVHAVSIVGLLGATGALLAARTVHTQEPTFRTGVTVVEMTVTVLDKDGAPRTDLRSEDFAVLENGVLQPIDGVRLIAASPDPTPNGQSLPRRNSRTIVTNAVQADQPLFVLLLDDLQISPRYTAAAQRIGRGLADALPQDARLAVLTTSAYKSALVTFDPPGVTHRGLINGFRGQALEGTSVEGATGVGSVGPLRDSKDCHPYCVDPERAARRMRVVEQVGRILGRAGSQRKVMFWVTESLGFTPIDLEEGRQAQRDALRALLNADVAVYTVDPRELRANARPEWFSRDELEAAVTLTEFARATGGQRFDNRNRLDIAVARTARQNLATYVLAYRATDAEAQGPRKVEVRLPGHPELTIHARTRYVPSAGRTAATTRVDASGLAGLLESPVSGGTLQMTLQLVTVPTPDGHGVVLLSLEGAARAPVGVPVDIALVTVNAAGDASDVASAHLAGPQPPWRVSRLMSLGPGTHQIRVAARSTDGSAAGVVVTDVDVPAWTPGELWLSDLMIADVSSDPTMPVGAPRLSTSIAAAAPVAAQFEVAGETPDSLDVDVVARNSAGQTWQTHAALGPGMSVTSRRATVVLPASILVAGPLQIRVSVRAPGVELTEREFTLAVR